MPRTPRTVVVFAVAAAAGLSALPAASAAPGAGRRCEVVPAQLTTSPTWRDGVLSGGPWVVPAYHVTLTCTLLVGGDVVAVHGKTNRGVGVVPPAVVSWPDLGDGEPAYVCTSVSWDYGPFLPIVGGSADLGCQPVP